jgi:hypothetical protein
MGCDFGGHFGGFGDERLFSIGFSDYSCYLPQLERAWADFGDALFPNFRDGLGEYPR